MTVYPREIQRYLAPNGKSPFAEWFESLRDIKAQARIIARLNRVAAGNLGDHRSLGDGVFELKIDYGPGYRIYFGEESDVIILLLWGGDKSRQNKDIRQAQDYWQDYRSRDNA